MKIMYLGFDVSKGYGDAEFCNEAGAFLMQHQKKYDDTATGHQLLSQQVAAFANSSSDVKFVIGLEASGGHERNWEKLFRSLKNNFNLELLVLNPVAVRKYLERNLRRNKTDNISARNLCEYLASGRRRQDVDREPELAGQRTLYHCITAAIGRRVQSQCELQSLLPSLHPELIQYCRDGIPNWVLELIKAYPTPDALARKKAKAIAKVTQISIEKANGLIVAAKTSVGSMTDEYSAQSAIYLANDIQRQNESIASLQKTLTNSLKDHPDVAIIDSIKGIGAWTAVILRLEYGTFEKFHSPDAAVAFAGLDPTIEQSGDMLINRGISHAGRGRIRSALFMPTLAAIRSNPVIRRFYLRLVATGKPEKVAIVACMRKLIHIIYACVITGKVFDQEYEKQHESKVKPFTRNAKTSNQSKTSPDLAAPVSRKEAKKRKTAVTMPQKDQGPLHARSEVTANDRINQ